MRIQGNLATYEFSDLLQWLAQGNKTGTLTVLGGGGVEYKLGFDHGRIDMSSSSDPAQRLDNYLYRQGVIDQETLARAERLRGATQMMSGQVLVTLGAVDETQLAHALRGKTEEILCELLTWEEGSFEFDGADRPESAMVPINLEVTKLLLESMHRLDEKRGGQHLPEPEVLPSPEPATPIEPVPSNESVSPIDSGAPIESVTPTEGERASAPRPEPSAAFVVAEPEPSVPSPDATQAIEGLTLAEVLDPEPPSAPESPSAAKSVIEMPSAELPAHYAAMSENVGPIRRLAPIALVVVLSLTAAGFYLANRQANAAPVGVGPGGEPILFTQTRGPARSQVEAAAETPAPVAAPVEAPPAAAESRNEQELRRRYEQELSDLRKELEEARRLGQAAGPESRAPVARPADAELPADSLMRAVVERSAPVETIAEPAVLQPPLPQPTRSRADRSTAADVPVPERPGPMPELSAPVEQRATVPAERAEVTALVLINPRLVTRPAPRYPVAAVRHRRSATVTVRVLIGADGRVEETERIGPKAGMGFDRAAEDAALASTWQPGTRGGEPVAMWAELHFEFKP